MRQLARARAATGAAPGETSPHAVAFLRIGLVALVGYTVGGRCFAQIGLPAANLFVGEALLAASFVYRPTRAVLVAAVRGLVQPSRFHALLWLLVVFVSYGMLQLVRGAMGSQSPIEAAKVFAFNYLVIYLFLGIAFAAVHPGAMAKLARVLPWVNAVYLLVFMLALRNVRIRLPLSAVPVLTPGMATTTVLALMVCYDRPVSRRWYLLATNVFLLLFLQIRGDWLGVIAAFALWAVVTRRFRGLLIGFGLAVLLLLTVSAAGIRIGGSASRGGAVNVTEIAARAIAPFDSNLAQQLSPEAKQYEGTTEWRRKWWGYIWAGVNETQSRQLFGYGYGFTLSDLFPQLSEEAVRTPHNIFFFTLGYSGWLGVGVFAVVQIALLVNLGRAYRATGNPFGLMIWVTALCAGLFGNFYETPYNALPYYVLIGMALAPISGELGAAAREALPAAARAAPELEGASR